MDDLPQRVRANEKANAVKRQEINDIFAKSRSDPDTPTLKLLATQIARLQSLNLQVKCSRLDRAKSDTIDAINKLHEQLAAVEQQLDATQKAIDKLGGDNTEETTPEILSIESYTRTVTNTVNRIHTSWFDIVVLALFDRRDQLLFCHRPIINIDDIATAPILDLNEFLENLIRFQMVLSELFDVDLPFIDELQTQMLPNLRFYDLIREKETQMRGDSTETDEKEPEDSPTPMSLIYPNRRVSMPTTSLQTVTGTSIETPPAAPHRPDILLPLSSKTINSQRRATITKVRRLVLTLPPPAITQTTLGTTRRVIIPHRILLVPLNKIGVREFTKFMATIIKILVNFHVYFASQGLKYTLLTNLRDLLARVVRREPLDEPRLLEVTKLLQEVYLLVVTRHLAPQLLDLNIVEMMVEKDDWESVTRSKYLR